MFESKVLNEHQKLRVEDIRRDFQALRVTINEHVRDSREKSITLTKIDEACMWAVRGISREFE